MRAGRGRTRMIALVQGALVIAIGAGRGRTYSMHVPTILESLAWYMHKDALLLARRAWAEPRQQQGWFLVI